MGDGLPVHSDCIVPDSHRIPFSPPRFPAAPLRCSVLTFSTQIIARPPFHCQPPDRKIQYFQTECSAKGQRNQNLTGSLDKMSFRGSPQTGVGIPRMRGTAERQALPPAFMRGEGHEVAGGVPRRSGGNPLSRASRASSPKGRAKGAVVVPRSRLTGGFPRQCAHCLGMTGNRGLPRNDP